MLKTAGKRWNDRDPWRESAIIAYYAIFSLPGLLLVIITLAGYFFEEQRISGYINEQITEAMGKDTARQVQAVINLAYDENQSLIATIIGVATILFGATGIFYQMQKSLNFIWDVKPDASSGILQIVIARLLSFGLIIFIAFLLLISLVVTTLISALWKFLQDYLPDYMMFLSHVINFVVSLGIITILFAIMFKYLPMPKSDGGQSGLVHCLQHFYLLLEKLPWAFILARPIRGQAMVQRVLLSLSCYGPPILP